MVKLEFKKIVVTVIGQIGNSKFINNIKNTDNKIFQGPILIVLSKAPKFFNFDTNGKER